jgi:ABC-type antimicrobial peptide transport system permease subunit
MLDEGSDLNMSENPDGQPPEERNNRTFLIVGGVMAGLIILTLVLMAVYFFVIAPRNAAQRNAAQATIEAGNALAIQQLTSTALAAMATATETPTPLPTNTPLPETPLASPTPLISVPLSGVASPTNNAATLAAMQTQLAYQMTSTAAAALGMPATGFFDEVGLPSMVILALALIVVIFLARRMRRTSPK